MGNQPASKRTRGGTTDQSDAWKTAITRIEPNKVLVRGYLL